MFDETHQSPEPREADSESQEDEGAKLTLSKDQFVTRGGSGEVRELATASQMRFTYLCTAMACLSSILLGYDIGVMSGAVVFMKRDYGFSRIKVEIIVSSLNFCAAGGSLIAGDLASRFGRRYTIAFAAVLFLGGSVLMSLADSFLIILTGRVILGIATGTGLLIAPLYSAELSPESIRGKLVSYVEISINIGEVLGYVCAYAFKGLSDDTAWRWMVALGALPSLLLFVAMFIMPESPRWLLESGRETEAREVLRMFLPLSECERSVVEIKETIEMERANVRIAWAELFCPKLQRCLDWCRSKCNGRQMQGRMRLDTISELGNAALRKALFVGFMMSFFQMGAGVEAVTYYTPMILEDVIGDNAKDSEIFLGTIIVGVVKLSFVFVATYNLDNFGRKPLLTLSSVILSTALAGLAISHGVGAMNGIGWIAVFWLCLYTAGFSIGWGPINWVLVAEIFPLTVRSQAMSFCMFFNRLLSGSVAMCFLSIQRLITTQGVWWLFCFVTVSSGFFVRYYVPETKGKTLEEITALLISQTRRHRRFSEMPSPRGDAIESSPILEEEDLDFSQKSELSVPMQALSTKKYGAPANIR